MAAKEEENNAWSWSSWLSSAKEKSLAALNATTRDLTEFVNVVQEDTTSAVSDAATRVKKIINTEEQEEAMNKSSKTILNETDGGLLSGDNKTAVYDRSQTHLEMIRSDPDTYCTIPEGQSAEFLEWSKDFDLSGQQEEISRLLVVSTSIRKLHSELVPAKVSYESFWHNYFYRVHLMNKTEAHRAEIMARVHSQGQLICWDDEEEAEEEAKRESEVTERAMTDSSESFVCINEEGLMDNVNENVIKGDDKEVEQVINEAELVNEGDSARGKVGHELDEWEKWDDD